MSVVIHLQKLCSVAVRVKQLVLLFEIVQYYTIHAARWTSDIPLTKQDRLAYRRMWRRNSQRKGLFWGSCRCTISTTNWQCAW